MSITPDYLIDRRQIKSRLLIWKLTAIILIAIVFLPVGKDFAPKEVLPINSNEDYIASVLIDEIILEDEKRDKN